MDLVKCIKGGTIKIIPKKIFLSTWKPMGFVEMEQPSQTILSPKAIKDLEDEMENDINGDEQDGEVQTEEEVIKPSAVQFTKKAK